MELKEQVLIKLDEQNLLDLKAVMSTVEGRRFFSWMQMKCGQDCTSFTRDSRTYFNEGMRNIALLLKSCTNALGLDGVDLAQKAEREYVIYQEELKQEIISKTKKPK